MIGTLSLGATNSQIKQLASLFWYTMQFGVCNENGEMKGFGAGIASSVKQLNHLKSADAKYIKFTPTIDRQIPFDDRDVQVVYRYTESLEDSFSNLRKYGEKIIKPFYANADSSNQTISYNRSIEGVKY